MKNCKTCGAEKPESEFYSKDSSCKPCRLAAVREYRAQNIDRIREYDRKRGLNPSRKAAVKKRYRERVSTPDGRKAEWEKKRKYSNGTKRAARVLFGNAVKGGKIEKKTSCEKCGAKGKISGHHEDYYRPFDVLWLCTACHGKRHREINEEIRSGVDWSDRGF